MKSNQLKSGVYLSYASIFISNLTNIILTPFIIRNLGQSEYGLYMLIGALIGYIAILDFGLGNTTVRYVAKYRAENNKKDEENFLSLTFLLYGLISVIILALGYIMYLNIENILGGSLSSSEISTAKTMFIVLVLTLALTLPVKSFTGIINAYQMFAVPRLFTIGRILIRAILIFIFLSLGYKAIAIVLIDAILNIVMLLATMAYAFIKLKVSIKLHYFNKKLFREIFSYSSLIFVSVIVDQFYWRIGHLILGIMAGTSEVAVFAIGISFVHYFITFSTAISGVFLPKITTMLVNDATNKSLTELLIKTGRLQFIVLGLALGGFALLGKRFLFLWIGPEFEFSWIIALIAMIPLTFVLTQTIGISILQAKNMHGFRALVYLGISVVNIIVSIFLVKEYGQIGAILGTVLSLIFGNIIIMNFYYHYRVGLNIPLFIKEVFSKLLISLILSVLIGTLLLMIPNVTWLTFILQSVLYALLYIVIMWKIGMNSYEKKLFKKELRRLKKVK